MGFCSSPRDAWKSAEGGRLSFHEKRGFDIAVRLPCGQCMPCRVSKRNAWMVRCRMEQAAASGDSSFVTLTYDDDHLPPGGSVLPRDRSLFLERLRKEVLALGFPALRYYGCDEYGPETFRPHYHILFFGFWPPDAVKVHSRSPYWSSVLLSDVWGKGQVSVGTVTDASIGYVSAHNVDKLTGPKAAAAYSRVDPDTGEVVELLPPRTFMSRRPGIGAPFLARFASDVMNPSQDFYVLPGGATAGIPRYIANRIAFLDSRLATDRETSRQLEALSPERQWDSSPARLKVREAVLIARTNFHKTGGGSL